MKKLPSHDYMDGYITKYALTTGVFVATVEIYNDKHVIYKSQWPFRGGFAVEAMFRIGKEFFPLKDDAVANAHKRARKERDRLAAKLTTVQELVHKVKWRRE